MRAVLQRVSKAEVEIEGLVVGGFLLLLGVAEGDREQDAAFLADTDSGDPPFFVKVALDR